MILDRHAAINAIPERGRAPPGIVTYTDILPSLTEGLVSGLRAD
jgi:hypothetical protein